MTTMKMKSLLLWGFAWLFSSLSASALVPEPGNIYYGVAKDFLGNILGPESGAEVVMIRKPVTGPEVIIARSAITEISTPNGIVNYILRPALDDGLASRFSTSAGRKDDVVGIYVIHDGLRFDISSHDDCIPISDPVPALAVKGTVVRVDFRYIDDADGDCMADSWEWLYYFTTEFDGTEDFDEDGVNGLAEFMRGTNPLIADFILGVSPANLQIKKLGENLIQLTWDATPGTNYEIQWSTTLENFTAVPAGRISGSGGTRTVVTTGEPRRFFLVFEVN